MKCVLLCVALVCLGSSCAVAQERSNQDSQAANPDAPSQVARDKAAQLSTPLSVGGKARYFAGRIFNPLDLITPALGAGVEMARADQKLPPEWRRGAGAYGRLYGSGLASLASFNTARFISGAALREDPRYFPAETNGIGGRIKHALLFTLVDRSDSGHKTLAVSNFVAAAAGGMVGNFYIPSPYNDPRYTFTRSAVLLAYFAGSNVRQEFNPELKKLRKKLHLP